MGRVYVCVLFYFVALPLPLTSAVAVVGLGYTVE